MYIIYNKSKYKKQAFTLRNKKNAYKIKISIYNQSKNLTYKIQKEKEKQLKKLFLFPIVGMTGLEPATTWSQTRYTTNCATSRFAEVSPYFCVAKVILFFYSCKYFSKIILLFLVQQRFFSRFELHALLALLYV